MRIDRRIRIRGMAKLGTAVEAIEVRKLEDKEAVLVIELYVDGFPVAVTKLKLNAVDAAKLYDSFTPELKVTSESSPKSSAVTS